MTAIPQPAPRPLSQRLLEPLRIVSARHRFLAFVLATCQLAVLAAASWFVIVLLLGSFREISPYVAIPLALAAWLILIIGFIQLFLRRPLFRRRNLASAARLVDLALPATQERISSALDLAQESDARFKGSPELIACLIRQAEKDADKLDPHRVVSGKSVLRWLSILLALFLVWLFVIIIQTPAVLLGFQRTIQPWTAAPLAPQAVLTLDPGSIIVAQGDPVTIKLAVALPPGFFPNPADLPRATLTRRFSPDSADTELASEMERTGQRTFQLVIPSVEQSFTYTASSLGAQSQTYDITVNPRPAVAAIEITYDFPKYTRLHPRTDISRDSQNAGAIDALVGTHVQITVEASQPLQSASILITDNAPNPASLELAPVPNAPTRYFADFTILKTTDYRIHLLNPQKLENKDNQPHPITARIDQPPQIAITSPTQTIKVRPDDSVPLQYTASDDFGIAAIEALVQIDNLPTTTLLVPLAKTPDDQPLKNTSDQFTLSLPDLLRGLPPNTQPKRISYLLRITDNRDPAPQSSLSAKQFLELDTAALPLAQREDLAAVKTLADAVKKAQAELQEARRKLDDIQQADPSKPLDEKAKQEAAAAQKNIADARQDLQTAAEQTADTRLQSAAREAQDIAEKPLQQAQENTAKTQLAADQSAARNQTAAQAQKNIDQAQQQLAALSQKLSDTANNLPRQQQLERLAAEQAQVAGELAKNPTDPKLQEQQAQLQKETEQFIKENPDFQKSAAQAHQNQADDLVKKIQNLEQAQQPFRDSLKNQTDAAGAKDKTADLAHRQQELNQQIDQFRNNQAAPLKQAAAGGAKPPDRSQLDPIVKDLQTGKLQTAAQAERAAGVKLDELAKRLDAQGNSDKSKTAAAQARDLADKQKALADETAQTANAVDAAADARANAQQNTRDQKALANEMDAAAKQAQSLSEQTKGSAPEMSQRAAQAQQSLQQAAQAEQNAAASTEKKSPSAAAQNQTDQQLAQAEEALTGKPSASPPQPPSAQNPSPSPSTANQNQNQPPSPKPGNPPQQANGQEQNKNQGQPQGQGQPTGTPQSANGQGQAQGQGQGQGQNQGQNPGASQSANSQGQSPGQGQGQSQSPGASQSANGQSQGNSQGQSPGQGQGQSQGQGQGQGQAPGASQSANGQGQGQGQGQSSGSSANGQGQGQGQGQAQGGSPGSGASPGKSPADLIQSARNDQSQAAKGDPDAARRATQELTQAAQQLAAGNGQPGPSSSGNSANPSGTSPASSGQPSSGNSSGSGGGTTATATPTPVPALPKSVQDIGISPSDWAHLPPNMQEQLLHAANQSGPPAYHEMIKNYYSRIAQLQQK